MSQVKEKMMLIRWRKSQRQVTCLCLHNRCRHHRGGGPLDGLVGLNFGDQPTSATESQHLSLIPTLVSLAGKNSRPPLPT